MPMIDQAGLRLVEGPLPGPESRAIGSKNRFRDTNRVRDPCVLELSFGAELVGRRGADPSRAATSRTDKSLDQPEGRRPRDCNSGVTRGVQTPAKGDKSLNSTPRIGTRCSYGFI